MRSMYVYEGLYWFKALASQNSLPYHHRSVSEKVPTRELAAKRKTGKRRWVRSRGCLNKTFRMQHDDISFIAILSSSSIHSVYVFRKIETLFPEHHPVIIFNYSCSRDSISSLHRTRETDETKHSPISFAGHASLNYSFFVQFLHVYTFQLYFRLFSVSLSCIRSVIFVHKREETGKPKPKTDFQTLERTERRSFDNDGLPTKALIYTYIVIRSECMYNMT